MNGSRAIATSCIPHRGAALVNGKIIRGTGDDYLISLDAETGKLLWAKQIANPKDGYFISMPPLVHGDLIYIGPAGSGMGQQRVDRRLPN